jgi:F1F0 ATPase subunit 2
VIGLDWLIPFSAGVLVGLVLGLVYFGGLWWTSRRIVSATGSPMLPALSLFGRLAVLAVALGLMANIQPFMLVGSLPGLVAARMLWIRSITDAAPTAPVSTLGLGRREDGHG